MQPQSSSVKTCTKKSNCSSVTLAKLLWQQIVELRNYKENM